MMHHLTHVAECETALQKSFDCVVNAAHLALETGCKAIEERDALKALVINVHQARGRYHSQIAMAALYEAVGLPNVKPVSGEKS